MIPVFAAFDPAIFAAIRGGAVAADVIEFDVFGLAFSVDAAGTGGFLLLLLVAAVGGLLLNLTPCVLPVIPLKIMGLSAAAENRRRCFTLGLSMSVGVVFFWMVLGGMIAGLKSFQSISELFQYPAFTISVGAIIVGHGDRHGGLLHHQPAEPLLRGPDQPRHARRLVRLRHHDRDPLDALHRAADGRGRRLGDHPVARHGAHGVRFDRHRHGDPLPHPERLPRSGEEDAADRQGQRGRQAGDGTPASRRRHLLRRERDLRTHRRSGRTPESPLLVVRAAAAVASGVWLLVQTWRIADRWPPRIVFTLVGGFITALSIWVGLTMTAKGPIDWVYYTPERFATAVAEDKVVVLDFTAEWCLNCKTLEATVLQTNASSPPSSGPTWCR